MRKISAKEAIIAILKESDSALEASEVESKMRSTYPSVHLAKSTISATLSYLHSDGVLLRQPGILGQYEYSVKPAIPAKTPVSQSPAVSPDLDAADPELLPLRYQTSLVPAILDAMTAVTAASDRASIAALAAQSLFRFIACAPWQDPDFFWVRCQASSLVLSRLSISITTKNATADQYLLFRRLMQTQYREIAPAPMIARDGGLKSESLSINGAYFSATAIIWCLITQLTEAESEHDAVQHFLKYATENYISPQHSDQSIVSVYQAIDARIRARILAESQALETNEQNDSSIHQENANAVTPSQSSAPLSLPFSLQSFDFTDDGALLLTLRIPPELLRFFRLQLNSDFLSDTHDADPVHPEPINP